MFRSTDKIGIIGRSGCGKSYLCKLLQKLFPRRIIFDSVNEYQGRSLRRFSDWQSVLPELKDRSKELEIIFQADPFIKNQAQVFDESLKLLYFAGHLCIITEEVQNFASVHSLPHWLRSCLLTGRHRDLALMFTTQRPGELHKTILSQCSHIFVGQLHDSNDIRYVSNFLGTSANSLAMLQERQFLYFSPGKGVNLVDNDLRACQPGHSGSQLTLIPTI